MFYDEQLTPGGMMGMYPTLGVTRRHRGFPSFNCGGLRPRNFTDGTIFEMERPNRQLTLGHLMNISLSLAWSEI